MIYFYNLSVKRFAVAAAGCMQPCAVCVVNKIAFNIFLGFEILMRFFLQQQHEQLQQLPLCLAFNLWLLRCICHKFRTLLLHNFANARA